MLVEIAFQILIPVLIGFFIGLYLDKLFSTSILCAAILSVVGMFAGIFLVYKKNS